MRFPGWDQILIATDVKLQSRCALTGENPRIGIACLADHISFSVLCSSSFSKTREDEKLPLSATFRIEVCSGKRKLFDPATASSFTPVRSGRQGTPGAGPTGGRIHLHLAGRGNRKACLQLPGPFLLESVHRRDSRSLKRPLCDYRAFVQYRHLRLSAPVPPRESPGSCQ